MQANPRSLDALFSSQLRYVVPMFQRLYVWQELPQWTTLWDDVVEKADLQLSGTPSNPHYLGAVIIEGVRPRSPREVKRFLVIDGQQRLTTVQLLFCAYRDIARQNGWSNLDLTVTQYLENSNRSAMEVPEEEFLKMWPTTLNRQIFRDIIESGSRAAVEKKYGIVFLPRKRKPEPRSNLVNAYVFFSKKIEAWISSAAEKAARKPEDAAFALLMALQQDFSVVEISLSDGDDSQEIFYSLNSQGRPLSQSDLLRSLIFMRAEKERQNRDDIFSKYWSIFETAFWSAEITRAGRSYTRLDLGLRYFLMAKTGQLIDARRVNEEYRRWISASPPRYSTVRDELADFTKFGESYRDYESANPSELPSTDIRRIVKDFDVSTALPLLLYLEVEAGLAPTDKARCFSIIESFLARRILVGDETKEYNKFFVEIIGTLRAAAGKSLPDSLEVKLLSGGGLTREWPTDAQVVEHAITRPLFNVLRPPALRLILERLELASRSKKAEDAVVPTPLQIEHVMPQKWSAHWPLGSTTIPSNVADYPSLASDELKPLAEKIRARNRSVHTLGNLTLVNLYLNPAAGNGPFSMKKAEYRQSVMRLNREFEGMASWDEDSIANRGRRLGELFCRIWPRPADPS